MSEILFVTWDGGGNVPPALAIARELTERGHTVRFLGHQTQAEALAAAGFEIVEPRHRRPFSALGKHSPLSFMAVFGDRGVGHDLLDAVAARPADLVVIDCLCFGALDAARRAGLQYAVLEHFYDAYYQKGCLRGPLGLSLAVRRLAPRRALDGAAARVLTTVPELDPVEPAPANLAQTGPVVDVAPVDPARDADPMVLVSLSTFAFPRMQQVLQNVVDGAAGLGARVVVTTGTALDPVDLKAPDGVEVHRFVPHRELMPRASLLVGHGGHGTTMQALAHDIPALLLPLGSLTDQPFVARSVEAAGAGRVLGARSTPAQLAPVMAELVAPGAHRVAAARLGEVIRGQVGARSAADRLETLLSLRSAR